METMLLVVKELFPMVLAAAVAASVSYYKGYKDGAEYAIDRIYEILEKQIEEIKLRLLMDIETEKNEKD